ncbi:2-amino-4-hydroxy-6-hydroxymethyldihydropteridine diphosphokinase [bacterium]|nr:MAG: 2-amino-4-hydroxy-6-hydroxymethyldihydropteridine diphosphokinase [bacterium]
MITCYLSIGSNLGERQDNIAEAINKIKHLKDTLITKVSSNIETEPVGGPVQGKYLNAAIEIQTNLSCRQLLDHLQAIERELGRVRTAKDGPRIIDLDILFYADQIINEDDLIVPHPRMKEREFVILPLKEIAPEVVKGLFRADNQKN